MITCINAINKTKQEQKEMEIIWEALDYVRYYRMCVIKIQYI